MVFQHSDENELVYPNLMNCQITATNSLLSGANKSLPPPPPPFAAAGAEALLRKPALEQYDFRVEKHVLAKNKERGGKGEMENGSVEVTLSDLKDALE
jgi:hypothetical protein